MDKKIFVLGAGGHASVLVDILKQNELLVSGLFSPDSESKNNVLLGITLFKSEDDIFDHGSETISLVNGIGSLPGTSLRSKLYDKFTQQGYLFQQVISKRSIISDFATLGKGVQVMPGAIIQAGAVIGENSIINSGAIIEHDCLIGAHNHIAPGVTLSGNVVTGNYVHIGTGANVIQSITIGDKAVIGAGANVTKNISAGQTAFGTSTEIKTRLEHES